MFTGNRAIVTSGSAVGDGLGRSAAKAKLQIVNISHPNQRTILAGAIGDIGATGCSGQKWALFWCWMGRKRKEKRRKEEERRRKKGERGGKEERGGREEEKRREENRERV